MLKTYAFRWPFAATIERLTLTEDALRHPLYDRPPFAIELEHELSWTESEMSVLRLGARSSGRDDKGSLLPL